MNFLFSKTNREFIVFLFFLALSGVFWLMMQLNETKEKEVHIAVRYVNVRKNAVLTSGETDTLRERVGALQLAESYVRALAGISGREGCPGW